ncbi:MAG: hypothetical protein ACLUS6_11880 [Dysosmobacter sp.]
MLNVKETAIAQDRQELIKSKFADWLWQDIDRRERLCRIYNDTFNSIRPREYDGQPSPLCGDEPGDHPAEASGERHRPCDVRRQHAAGPRSRGRENLTKLLPPLWR